MNKNAIIGIVVGGIVVVAIVVVVVVVVLKKPESEVKVRIQDGIRLQWSTDNKNWQNAKVPTSIKKVVSVKKGNNMWVAAAINNSKQGIALSSKDGKTWSISFNSQTPVENLQLSYTGNKWFLQGKYDMVEYKKKLERDVKRNEKQAGAALTLANEKIKKVAKKIGICDEKTKAAYNAAKIATELANKTKYTGTNRIADMNQNKATEDLLKSLSTTVNRLKNVAKKVSDIALARGQTDNWSNIADQLVNIRGAWIKELRPYFNKATELSSTVYSSYKGVDVQIGKPVIDATSEAIIAAKDVMGPATGAVFESSHIILDAIKSAEDFALAKISAMTSAKLLKYTPDFITRSISSKDGINWHNMGVMKR